MRFVMATMIVMLFAPFARAAEAFQVPHSGEIVVAFVVTDGANVIDIAGPWEAFQDTLTPDGQMPFRLVTVSDRKAAVRLTGGLTIVPDFTFGDELRPNVIVVGAQRGSDKLTPWLRARYGEGSAIMSVCTGAFKLAATGLLDGKKATTHHDYMKDFATRFPKIELVPGKRFVQSDERLFTAGGLTSGIDLALHVVSLYLGEEAAARTADFMEYKGEGWRRPQRTNPRAPPA